MPKMILLLGFSFRSQLFFANNNTISKNNNNNLISPRRPDLIIINKKERTCRIVDFAVREDHGVKLKEYEKKDKYLDLARKLKKTVEHESDNYTNCNWCSQ